MRIATRATIAFVAALGATEAMAQSQDEQQACMNDAFQFCQQLIPDRDRVFHCLVANRTMLSQPCYALLSPHLPVDPPPVSKAKASKTKKTLTKKSEPRTATGKKGPVDLNPR
jgi:hypothetical protein